MIRSLPIVIALLLLGCLGSPAIAKGLKDEYSAILASECSAKRRGVTDERELSWGCTQEKTKQLNDFRARLEKRLEAVMKSHEPDEGGDLKTFREFERTWESYQKATNNFDIDFHLSGSMGTSLRLESKQEFIKQRIELLLQYLLDYYNLDGIK